MSSSGSGSDAPRLWPRAAAIGSLWAAIEITVGSLLHNLRIPFGGTLLAAGGVLLMTAALQRWQAPGLVWRAALIAALMKSISPSAVILGPMVGIFSEGVILFLAVSLLGRGPAGCLAGGALAVSWTLAQKILLLLVTYGLDFIALYEGLIRFAARATGWRSLGPADIVLGLLAVQASLGAVAGLTGWWLGRRPTRAAASAFRAVAPAQTPVEIKAGTGRAAALPFLSALLVAGLWWTGKGGLWVGGIPVLAAAIIMAYYYRRGMRRLAKPRLWIELAAVMLLSGLVLGALGGSGRGWTAGLLAGAEMAVRAVFVVVLFSAIGIELRRSPWLQGLTRGRFAAVRQALEAAFQALPDFVASLRELPGMWRRPRQAIGELLDRAELWQEEFERSHRPCPCLLLTGSRGSGKTTLLEQAARRLKSEGCRVAGILSPGYCNDGVRSRFDLLILDTGERLLLAERNGAEPPDSGRCYRFLPETLAAGRAALAHERIAAAEVVFVDEVGPMELRGEGWAPALERLAACGMPMVWTVRPSLVEEVRRRWNLAGARVIEAGSVDAGTLAGLLAGRAEARQAAGGNA